MRLLAIGILASITLATEAFAEIKVYECNFKSVGQLVFTLYSDGTSARVGVKSGVGNKALNFYDQISKAISFVETNTDGFPITFTTINREMKASHSRQLISLSGDIIAPSRTDGTCKIVP